MKFFVVIILSLSEHFICYFCKNFIYNAIWGCVLVIFFLFSLFNAKIRKANGRKYPKKGNSEIFFRIGEITLKYSQKPFNREMSLKKI